MKRTFCNRCGREIQGLIVLAERKTQYIGRLRGFPDAQGGATEKWRLMVGCIDVSIKHANGTSLPAMELCAKCQKDLLTLAIRSNPFTQEIATILLEHGPLPKPYAEQGPVIPMPSKGGQSR